MNLFHWLERTAREMPQRPALFEGTKCVATYAEFCSGALNVAGWLRDQGIVPGDRVAIFMQNCTDYLVVFYGVWAAGASVVPINAKLHGREAAYILENSGARFVFASTPQVTALTQADVACRVIVAPGPGFDDLCKHPAVPRVAARAPDDLAWLFYTSGTTGKPKGVMMTHRMLMCMSLTYSMDVDAVSSEDTTLYAAPMSHGAGMYNMIHVRAGARHLCPPSGGFDPAEIFALAARFGRVHMFAAPTMVKRMTDAAGPGGPAGTGLRTVVYAGGPMYMIDILAAVERFGPVFVQIYGQGECPMGITALSRAEVADRTHPRWRERVQSVGRAQSPVEVAIGNSDAGKLPVGTHGEIMVRGDTVMPGYWRNEAATQKTLVNGWLMTGDMGVLDADGYLTLQDRSKDMIITGGSNVYPREVEEVLLRDPDVHEVSVVGRPHPEWGEEVVAFIVGQADPVRLDKLCLDNIARFKRPKAYIAVDTLPKNNYGKVLKTELRARLVEGVNSVS